jgi:hypothetical protein
MNMTLIFFPQLPSGHTRKVLASKRKNNTRPVMAPGCRVRKRVTVGDPEASVTPPPPQTRSKRHHPSETDVQEQVPQNSYTADGEEADGHGETGTNHGSTSPDGHDEVGFEYSTPTAADHVHGEEDSEGKF